MVWAKDLYSASMLSLASVYCFQELQEIRWLPKYMQKPHVDHLSLGQLAQSTFE